MNKFVCIGLMSVVLTISSRAIAQEAPVIINPQTGAVVDLARAYWDANVDIANKRMQCDYFSFDTQTGDFVKGEDKTDRPIFGLEELHIYNTEYSHPPLPNEIGQFNIARVELSGGRNLYEHLILPFWSVIDGNYTGPAPLAESRFVEFVAVNSSTDNAVRVWFPPRLGRNIPDQPLPSYSVCYDLDGTSLLPSGTVDSGNTQLVDLDEFTLDFPDAYESTPEIINLETGETVQYLRGRWSYNKNIAGSIISCAGYAWRGASGSYERTDNPGASTAYYPYNGGEEVLVSSRESDNRFYWIGGRRISGGDGLTVTLPPTYNSERYMEITEYGYRMWSSSIGRTDCIVESAAGAENLPFGPTEILPLTTDNNCDYSTADQYDGYGWNPITRESCPPLETTETPVNVTPETLSGCDYSNAVNGWGWNETTRQSCPPLTVAEQQTTPQAPVGCDYSSAINGWGWNETTKQSCPPLTVVEQQTTSQAPSGCDYSNAINGWGWNESTRQSCPPLTEAEEQTTPQVPAGCDYSNAVDGWGWNETIRQSCEPL